MVLRQLARAFALWRYTAEKLNEEKRLLGGAAARWMDQQLSAAWNTWRNAINERKRQETLLRRSLMWLIDRHKARAFAKWVEFVQQREDARRQARRALSLWQKQNVARAFRQWLACTTRKQAQEESNEAVDSDLVAKLRAEIAELKRVLALCSQTCNHIPGCPVCKSSELDAKQMMMKRALEGMFNLQMARAWRKWRDWRKKLLMQAQAARKVLSRWQNQLICKAYNKLKEHARVMRVMMDIIRKWNRRMLTMAWNTWLEYSAAYSEQIRAAKNVMSKMLRGPFTRSFDIWRSEATRSRRIAALLKRCALRWSRSQLFEAFHHMMELSELKRLEDLEFSCHLTNNLKGSKKKKKRGNSTEEAPAMIVAGSDQKLTCLFVVGGQDGLARATPVLERMDPSTGQWSYEGEFPEMARMGHGCILRNPCPGDQTTRVIYTIGGRHQVIKEGKVQITERLASMEILEGGVSRNGPSMATKRNDAGCAYLNDRIYVTGGGDGHTKALNTMEVFHIPTGKWTKGAGMLKGRVRHRMIPCNGRLYVFGGCDCNHDEVPTGEMYNPETEEWTQVAPMKEARSYAAVSLAGGCIYLMGGSSGMSNKGGGVHFVDTVERYDPVKNTWKIMPKLPSPMCHVGAAHCGGFIYVTGGQTLVAGAKYPSISDGVIRFDPTTNAWSDMPSLMIKRSHHRVAAVRMEV